MCNWRMEGRGSKVGVLSICDMKKRSIVMDQASKVEWMIDGLRLEHNTINPVDPPPI